MNKGAFKRIYPSAHGMDAYAPLAAHVHGVIEGENEAAAVHAASLGDAWARQSFAKGADSIGTTWELHAVSAELESIWSAQSLR